MKLFSLISLNAITIRSPQVQKHKCTQGRCTSYFPLQVCGNICGASVVMCGCLAAYAYELFERFCTFQVIRQSADLSSIKYLKNFILWNASKGSAHEVVYRK